MKVAQKYSHLNGEEYLIVHHQKEYDEILKVINAIDAKKHKTKKSKESGKKGRMLYSPGSLNKEFITLFNNLGWTPKVRRDFYVSTDPNLVKQLEAINLEDQKKLLDSLNLPKHKSYNETDFIKNKIAIEVQMGKYFAVTYDLFVKHLNFYSGALINVGIEIVPTKNMQVEMSSGPPWFE